MARAYAEMFTPRSFDLTTFGNDAAYDGLIIARSIPVQSVCEHHLLPFVGVAHVGYLPGERILACPSWLGWSSCSRDAPRCKNGSPNKLLIGSKSTLRRAVWVSSWKPNIYA
jgi:hypothetical protein